MSSAGRATGVPARRTRARANSPASPLYDDLPFASRLKTHQRSWVARLNSRETLVTMVQAVNGSIEPEQIGQAVVERVAALIPAHCWAIVAIDEQEQLAMLCETGLSPEFGPALYAAAEFVMRHEELLVSGDARKDSRLATPGPAAVLALPLRGREHTIAVLVGLDRGVSTQMPAVGAPLERALRALLAPAAYALDTALLLKRTEALSVTDDLTRLYNARYLNTALRRETRLATRNSRPLSLLFIDLDGFKSINDSHGHLAGSRALVEAGAVIRGSARETDIVARFGGDEFALILPDTGSPGARAVAERIRERIARHSFLAGDGLDIHLTASVGVATLPDVAIAADELVQAADAAMYRVKDRGKNGIQVAVSDR
jgi:diguanylate cyclase (GGDEF)-like protein